MRSEIVKTKGEHDQVLLKEVEMELISGEDVVFIHENHHFFTAKLRRLPKSKNLKKILFRTCPIYGERLIPFPSDKPNGFLPEKFVGDILLGLSISGELEVKKVLIKYALEEGRVIQAHEFYNEKELEVEIAAEVMLPIENLHLHDF